MFGYESVRRKQFSMQWKYVDIEFELDPDGVAYVPITYRGYTGTVEYSEEENIYFGNILKIKPLVTYKGYDIDSMINDFYRAVSDYIGDRSPLS